MTKRTDRRGLAREFSYDPLGRLTSEVWKNGGSTVRTISFAYNAGSALTSASDADSSYAYTYDNLGRVTNVDNNGTSGVPRVQLASAYDANGNRTSLSATITSTLDLLNSYTYDGLNRLTRLDQTGQSGGNAVAEKRVDFAYNARGQFSSIARYKDTDGGSGNEVATSTFAYDNLGRLTALDHKHSTTDLANYDRTYDAASRVTQFAYSHLVGGSGTSDYSYDNTNQVTATNHSGLTDESYSFDESGNRTGGGYSTGDDNQLSSDGTFNYTYDDEGNRLTRTRISSSPADDKTVEFTWDHRNRLTKVKNKDETSATTQVVEYIYDLYDRKIGRKVDSDGDADWDSVERYIYDLDDVVLDFLDADGDGGGSQALSKRYLWGPAVDQLLAQEDVSKSINADDRVLWPLVDNLGGVRDIADQTGDIVNHIEYDSFGKPARVLDGSANSIALSALPTRYLYTTREYDSLTDLQYNRARWYDPATGKWLSVDPIGFAAGDTNLSRYVGNNATNATDPSGLKPPDLGPLSGRLDEIARDKDRNALARILAGMLVGPAALVDTIPRAIGQAASESREQIAEQISNSDSIVDQAAGGMAYGLTYFGQGFAYYGNGMAVRYVCPIPGSLVTAGLAKFWLVQGQIILGRYPGYVYRGIEEGAVVFTIPMSVWRRMSRAEKEAAEQAFLEAALRRGDKIILHSPPEAAPPGSWYRWELDYLLGKGCKFNREGTELIPPGAP